MQPPTFLYFDMGNVLLYFDHRLSSSQMAEVAGTSAERVWDVVFASGLELRYEAGELNDEQFYEIFCRETDTCPDQTTLLAAGSRIFWPNASILPLVAALQSAGHRLGVLSNSCSSHWGYCSNGRFGVLKRAFEVYAISYQLGACKPSPKIFAGAARLAGVPPQEIFFVDDVETHVTAARAAGFDAVQYTTTPKLVADLRARGLEFNY